MDLPHESAVTTVNRDYFAKRKALVVLSGGQDSTTVLLHVKDCGYKEVHAISFDYGQRHKIEIAAASRVAEIVGVDSHHILNVRGLLEGSSPLVNPSATLETYTDYESMDRTIGNRVELTFVPLRNLFFLVVAANHALALGCYDVYTGVCQMDNANYPDCTQAFLQSAETCMREALGMKRTAYDGPMLHLHAPLMYRDKAETVNLAMMYAKGVEALAESHTCYAGQVPPCGKCHACVLRAEGFRVAGVADPLVEKWKGVTKHIDTSYQIAEAEIKELENFWHERHKDAAGNAVVDPYFTLIGDIQARVNEAAKNSASWSISPQVALRSVAERLLGQHFEFSITNDQLVIIRYIPQL